MTARKNRYCAKAFRSCCAASPFPDCFFCSQPVFGYNYLVARFVIVMRSPRLARFFLLCLLVVLSHSALAQPYGMTSRPAVGQFLDNVMPESSPVVSGNWSAVVAFTNLYFTNALGVTYVPGTSKLVVWEREGRVFSFTNTPSANSKTLVLDISNQCQGWDDSGLLNVAFHPGFNTNHYVFVYYTWVTPGTVVGSPSVRPAEYSPGKYHDRISRFTLDVNNVAIWTPAVWRRCS